MKSPELWMSLLSLLIGVFVGVLYFAGLWWTVLKKASEKKPVAMFLISFLVRASIACTLFYLVAQDHPWRWGCLLVGFVVSRRIIVKKYAPNT